MFKPKSGLSNQVTMPDILCCDSDFIKKELSVCILICYIPHTVIENKVVFCYLWTGVCILVFGLLFSTENFCLPVSRAFTPALLKILTKNGVFFVQSDLPLKRGARSQLSKTVK